MNLPHRIILVLAVALATVADAASQQKGTVIEVVPPVTRFIAQGNSEPASVSNRLSAGQRLTSGEGGSALIQWDDNTKFKLRELSSIEVMAPPRTNDSLLVKIWDGAIYLFSRDKPREREFQTPHVVGGARGTEYEVRVSGDRTVVTLLDGEVDLSSPRGRAWHTNIKAGEFAVIVTNETPQVFTLVTTNLVQWWLHYPAVLDVDDLAFPPTAQSAFAASLSAWRRGNLRLAWQQRPADRTPESDAERLYQAALRLAVGEVGQAESLLAGVSANSQAALGLRELIIAVARTNHVLQGAPTNATAWLGRSYLHQARRDLPQALAAARAATNLAPSFGFTWARLAELQFSFGNVPAAKRALTRALELSPDNAAAHALNGFVLAAENRLPAATNAFAAAQRLDSSLADAWLGRGLTSFRAGEPRAGLDDLQTAATLERNRSMLRSYLGKGFAENRDPEHASAEFELAKKLDPQDPTPWLYSALDHYARNEVNQAISDLESSLALNDQRAVYRSQLLLDQDRAVRATSLARLYERAGMSEVALREAAYAVASDYANPSAHLFLADAFNSLRDPTRFNLRYETVWFNEVLLANALTPVDAGVLSPSLSQQEYTRLFTRDGFSTSSFGEASSDGQFRELATQAGVFGRTAYALDVDWQHNEGVRTNNGLHRVEVYAQIKQQVTAKDTAMLLTKFEDYNAGDNFQYRDPTTNARPQFHFQERQQPLLVGLWRHEWTPGIQTLALAGRLENDQHFSDIGVTNSVLILGSSNNVTGVVSLPSDVAYRGRFETYVGELNQIAQLGRHTLVGGGRVQAGEFQTEDQLVGAPANSVAFGYPTNSGILNTASVREDFTRLSLYAYDTWRMLDHLTLTAGVAWDDLHAPDNFRHPPITPGTMDRSGILPKAALIWQPFDIVAVRGMYAQSLGGVSFDESYRLEPVQLAGFSQAFRSVIPESLVGSVSGHRLELGGAALDLKLPSRTYFGVQATTTRSAVDQDVGVFDYSISRSPRARPAKVQETLRYEENTGALTINQLVGQHWAFGLSYGFSRAELDQQVPVASSFQHETADLHQVRLLAVFNAANGLFARTSALWLWQTDRAAAVLREHHCQLGLEGGWRFPRQFGDISIGVANLLDDDYRLAPLSAVPELPRKLVVFGRLRLNF